MSWLLITQGNANSVYKKGANSSKLFAYLPVMAEGGCGQSKDFSEVLLENGSLLIANYSGGRFRPDMTKEHVTDRVNEFKESGPTEVVFDGTSMGGMTASSADLIDYKTPLGYLVLYFLLIRPGFFTIR